MHDLALATHLRPVPSSIKAELHGQWLGIQISSPLSLYPVAQAKTWKQFNPVPSSFNPTAEQGVVTGIQDVRAFLNPNAQDPVAIEMHFKPVPSSMKPEAQADERGTQVPSPLSL